LGGRIADVYVQYADVLRSSSTTPLVDPVHFSLGGAISTLTGAPLTPVLRVAAAVAVLGWVLFADIRLQRDDVRPFVLYLLAIPIASPKSEVHHLAFILPAAALVAGEWRWPSQARQRTFSAAGSAAAVLYIAATVLPFANGLMDCAALIATAVALNSSRTGVFVQRRADG
jgi:hypothetical protein